MKTLKIFLLITIFISVYLFTIFNFFVHKSPQAEYPVLRSRFGTILSHSSDTYLYPNNPYEDHLYCYYPSSSVNAQDLRGEYIIKRVVTIKECEGWHGMITIQEGPWVSEIEKIFWEKDSNS